MLTEKLQIYRDITKHRVDQTYYLKQDVEYKLEFVLLLNQLFADSHVSDGA